MSASLRGTTSFFCNVVVYQNPTQIKSLTQVIEMMLNVQDNLQVVCVCSYIVRVTSVTDITRVQDAAK